MEELKNAPLKDFLTRYFRLISVVLTFLVALDVFFINISKDKIMAEIPRLLDLFKQNLENIDLNEKQITDKEIDDQIEKIKEDLKKGLF